MSFLLHHHLETALVVALCLIYLQARHGIFSR